MEIAECSHCLIQFGPERSDAKYCCDQCRKDASAGRESKTRKINEELKEKNLPTLMNGSAVKTEFISTGITEIDDMTGGFPKRKITEIYGMKGVGKTALVTKLFNADSKILYVDTENALGEVPSNVTKISEYILEDVERAVHTLLGKDYDMIVVDSVASMIPRAEVEGDEGDAHMGLKARLMSQWMRKVNMYLSKSNAALVFINQERETMNAFGYQKFTPGGHGLPYAASLRLELKTTKKDRLENGHWVNVEVEKSRVCKPYQTTRFKLEY